jgi:hypothetical protein
LGSGSGTIGYTATETASPLAGRYNETLTGTDRYSLLQQFANVSDINSGSAPGHMNFSPFGTAFVDQAQTQQLPIPQDGWHTTHRRVDTGTRVTMMTPTALPPSSSSVTMMTPTALPPSSSRVTMMTPTALPLGGIPPAIHPDPSVKPAYSIGNFPAPKPLSKENQDKLAALLKQNNIGDHVVLTQTTDSRGIPIYSVAAKDGSAIAFVELGDGKDFAIVGINKKPPHYEIIPKDGNLIQIRIEWGARQPRAGK